MKFKKMKMDVRESRQRENMAADLEKQKALTEYVAMMADVDLPTETQEDDSYEA